MYKIRIPVSVLSQKLNEIARYCSIVLPELTAIAQPLDGIGCDWGVYPDLHDNPAANNSCFKAALNTLRMSFSLPRPATPETDLESTASETVSVSDQYGAVYNLLRQTRAQIILQIFHTLRNEGLPVELVQVEAMVDLFGFNAAEVMQELRAVLAINKRKFLR